MNARNFVGRSSVLALLLCAMLAACGGPLRFAPKGTPKAPEADAEVVADVDQKTSLTRLTVKVEHLAPPDRLQPGGTTFVVWVRKMSGPDYQRVGALAYDADGRKGEIIDASVPLTSFELIVSIEKQPAPDQPSRDVVIMQKVQEQQ